MSTFKKLMIPLRFRAEKSSICDVLDIATHEVQRPKDSVVMKVSYVKPCVMSVLLAMSVSLSVSSYAGHPMGATVYPTGSTPFVTVDSSRPFDMNAYRYLGLKADQSGNTLPTDTSALGVEICKDGTADCLIQGKRIIYGRIFYPVIRQAGFITQILGGQAKERYCDRYFGRDPNTGRCQSTTSANSIEFNNVFKPYQDDALGFAFTGFLPGVTMQDFDNAVKALWNEPTGSVLANNLLVASLLMPSNKRFPLVIVGGGNTGKYHELAVEAKNMASQGYIVIVLDQVGNSTFSQIGKLPLVQSLNPNVVFKPGGVNPVSVSLFDTVYFSPIATRSLTDQFVEDARVLVSQLKDRHNLVGALLKNRVDLNAIGYVGYSFGTLTGQNILESIPDIKAGVLVNSLFNISIYNVLGGYGLFRIDALSASGAEIPGWSGNFINLSSPALAIGFTKPVLVLQTLQDQVVAGVDPVYPISNPTGSYPVIQGLLNNDSTGPSFLAFVANADHFTLHSGALSIYYFDDLLNRMAPSQEGGGNYTKLPGKLGVEINSYEQINMMDAYLKNKAGAVQNLENLPSVYPDGMVIIHKP